MRDPAAIVRPTDTIDSDEWSIITNRRQINAAIRTWLADNNPELLHHLEHSPTDLPGGEINCLSLAVDELIDHIKAQP